MIIKKRRLIWIMVSLMLLLAAGSVSAADKRPLTVEFMGKGANVSDSGQPSAQLTEADRGEFWIGVGVEKIDDLDLFSKGIYSMEIAFEYDTAYVEPYYTTAAGKESEWKAELVKGNLGDSTKPVSAWWTGNVYDIESSSAAGIDTNDERERIQREESVRDDEWKMCVVNIKFTGSSVSDMRFRDITDNGKQYLIKLPFILKDIPNGNPRVIRMVRGPETFNIGSGTDGIESISQWEAITNVDGVNPMNLKNLFEFKGDISLFGSSEDAITDIRVITSRVPEGTEISDETREKKLYHDDDLVQEGFVEEQETYYVSVENETEAVKIYVASDGEVMIDGGSTTVESIDGVDYKAKEVELTELDPDTVDTDGGFTNIVTVQCGDKEYTLKIRRLLKPRIELAYGNSPYGEIMRAGNIADSDKQAAKDAFNVGNIYRTYIPDRVQKKLRASTGTSAGLKTNIDTYTYKAWVDMKSISEATEQQLADLANPDINMDRNDYAIFVYNGRYFVDPGFTAIDSMGKLVENLDRTITVNRMAKGLSKDGIYDGNYVSDTITIEDQPSEYLFTELTRPYVQGDMSCALIRPDVYKMTYSFTDEYGVSAEAYRYVIVLQPRGDADFSNSITLQDLNPIYQYYNRESEYYKTSGERNVITGTARSIYVYRCLDLSPTNAINLQDLNPIYQYYNKYRSLSAIQKEANNNPVEEWYVELPNSL